MEYLDTKLYGYSRSDFYPFHMPGHKRRMTAGNLADPYQVDITEITDFDNLHHAEGILKENQEAAAELYGAEQSYFLVNGSTAGILAAVSACTERRGRILMARNCHKAVYHAVYLRELTARYLYPALDETLGLAGGISPEDTERELRRDPEIQAVLITSPTYDGLVSPVEKIAQVCHRHGVPLIVDEAHGAHFPFSKAFPASALELGADIVIQSLHKTLPSLTQTAVLHSTFSRVDKEKLERFLGIYQSSSPSYVLMGSITACLRYLKEQGKERFSRYEENLEEIREHLKELQCLRLLGEEVIGRGNVFDLDRSKLVIFSAGTGMSGPWFHDILRREHHLEMEMEAEQYVLALTSLMDTREGFSRLEKALFDIDEKLVRQQEAEGRSTAGFSVPFAGGAETACAQQVCRISEGMELPGQEILLTESEGRISAEYAYLYPPGIPLLVPGERISRAFLEQAERLKGKGLVLQGMKDYTMEKIMTVKE